MDGQTDGHCQVHYLPASQLIINSCEVRAYFISRILIMLAHQVKAYLTIDFDRCWSMLIEIVKRLFHRMLVE